MADRTGPTGWPGIEPRWTRGDKEAVGTAFGRGSRVWFTLSQGVVSEVYYPSPDQANVRDLQFLITGPDGLFLEQRRDFRRKVHPIAAHVPAYELDEEDFGGRVQLRERVLTDPDANALFVSLDLSVVKGRPEDYRLFALLAPHVANHGFGNFSEIGDASGRPAIYASRGGTCLCLVAEPSFTDRSCTYSGFGDAYWDIRSHGHLAAPSPSAPDGNLALAGEIPWQPGRPVRLALGFGRSREDAAFAVHRLLTVGEPSVTAAYVREWKEYLARIEDLTPASFDGGHLFRQSARVLRTHMDKRTPGALVASLSIPWGYAAGDGNVGGYHLVWSRDLYEAATAFLALGDFDAARQCLTYLAAIQRPDGSWPQNSWLDGRPYWPGTQLDEVAFPVILAYRLEAASALGPFDPWPMAKSALGYLLRAGPDTPQDRWEEDSGYSPSTFAAELAALVVGAEMASARGERKLASLLLETADAWLDLLDRRASVPGGMLDPTQPYYVRIAPVGTGGTAGRNGARGYVPIKNLAAGVPSEYPIGEIVDGGFLELVRYGIKPADDPLVVNTLKIVDRTLRVETPHGPVYHRYSHDGYGEHADGSAYDGAGIGRAWPLLTGERGHYDIAAGGDAEIETKTIESIAGACGLIPEQVWDAPDLPQRQLFFGEATGSARPLVWAHAEYVKLLRSRRDRRVFDRLSAAERHFQAPRSEPPTALWSFAHPVREIASGQALKLWLLAEATVHWTIDGWHVVKDSFTQATGVGVYVLDLPSLTWSAGTTLEFTFYWEASGHWEGQNFAVSVVDA